VNTGKSWPHVQTRLMSAVETAANILIGFAVSFASQVAFFPLFDIHLSMATNLQLTFFFTVVSVIRSYALRRFFNSIRTKI
jgi:hypothetical protein